MLNSTASETRLRERCLPGAWTVADKTGGGPCGTNNNVGIAWTEDDTPLVLSIPVHDAHPGCRTGRHPDGEGGGRAGRRPHLRTVRDRW
ncbi:hypothetical protein ACIHCQ_36530 [Streptomyces sp. NPDC052236]|uniref:hypothetical protein n=1 Tax=Streptomyces sp. NPDC052236 TaxID=3365686 RepID=UPI0037D52882